MTKEHESGTPHQEYNPQTEISEKEKLVENRFERFKEEWEREGTFDTPIGWVEAQFDGGFVLFDGDREYVGTFRYKRIPGKSEDFYEYSAEREIDSATFKPDQTYYRILKDRRQSAIFKDNKWSV